ncbi:MAG: hypothetical protein M0021_06280 [Clostridia bacterium]|nr:hypothetical protein [Clostridia bacterium]
MTTKSNEEPQVKPGENAEDWAKEWIGFPYLDIVNLQADLFEGDN